MHTFFIVLGVGFFFLITSPLINELTLEQP